MALIREILINRGVIAENDTESTFTNIPIQLIYDQDPDSDPKIVDVQFGEPLPYTVNDTKSPIVRNPEISRML
jgi:hypothetical protein